MQTQMQPKLFEIKAAAAGPEDILMYALGDFQSRGHLLSGRELALDRLHAAFVRACAIFGIELPSDKEIAAALSAMGARVDELPDYAAKRPFRITIPEPLAIASAEIFLKKKRLL